MAYGRLPCGGAEWAYNDDEDVNGGDGGPCILVYEGVKGVLMMVMMVMMMVMMVRRTPHSLNDNICWRAKLNVDGRPHHLWMEDR